MTTAEAVGVALMVLKLALPEDPLAKEAVETLEMLRQQRGCEEIDSGCRDGRLTTLCDIVIFG